ncbi:MAG TPA: GNAT family N-acetyltransferase [Burkholderiales bacterium]|nr:GNAT family N-acetyltransferase [Burkholderiales bacterium]
MSDKALAVDLRPATHDDVEGIVACVSAAYGPYVERIGRKPGPMLADYRKLIHEHQVFVAERGGVVAGVLVLAVTKEGFLLENVAVDPAFHGRGIGRRLLQLAEDEARRQGFGSIYLYTHARMTENREHYAKIGYIEYDQRVEDGYARIYMRKPLR